MTILLLPLKEFSCSCVQVSCLFSHVFLTAQEKDLETQKNEHVKNVKWTGKSKEVFERRQRQRAEVIVETETALPATGWQQNWNRKEWPCLICALHMWSAHCLCFDHSPIKEICPSWTITSFGKLVIYGAIQKFTVKIYDSKSNLHFFCFITI